MIVSNGSTATDGDIEFGLCEESPQSRLSKASDAAIQLIDAGEDDKAIQMATLTSEFLALKEKAEVRRSTGQSLYEDAIVQRDTNFSTDSTASLPLAPLVHCLEIDSLIKERVEANRQQRPWTPRDYSHRYPRGNKQYRLLHRSSRTLGDTTPIMDNNSSGSELPLSTMIVDPEQAEGSQESQTTRLPTTSQFAKGDWASVINVVLYNSAYSSCAGAGYVSTSQTRPQDYAYGTHPTQTVQLVTSS